MHKCIVCGNTSNKTKVHRPGVNYHGIPKNEHMRRKWLKVFGIDRCHDWQRICSDHFLEENYKPGKKRFLFSNTIPQPYDRNGFPSNYATQSNDVETGNNVILPMEQNIIKEEHIGNTVVNHFKSPRQSSRLTRNNEDMSNTNMPDHTLVSGLQCSVRNCSNRLSKNFSLFEFPKDLMLRKLWMEKCGLKKNLFDMSSERVCSNHFRLNRFMNSEVKPRLKPGAVPSLFLNTDIVNTKNIPSTSFCVNRWLFQLNKKPSSSSSSSSNFVTNMEINKIPLSVLIKSTTRNSKDFEVFCSVPECITNTKKEVEDISLFVPTMENVKEWSKILGVRLTGTSILCEKHFRSQDMVQNELFVNGLQTQLKVLAPFALPVPINEEPILSTSEDQFISAVDNEAAEQSSEEKKNNLEDDTDNTSMTIDLTIDDSSSSSLSITLEPMEERTSQCIKMNDCNTEYFTSDEHGLIFEMSKEVVLPSLYWKSEHLNIQNATRFFQRDANDVTVKKVNFYNNLVPTIQIYGKKYEYNTPIKTKEELDNLLEKIDSIEKCYGRGGFVFEQCKGYFENSLDNMCSGCQGLVKDQDLQRMKAKLEAKNKKLESFKNRIAEKKETVLKLRRKMAEIKRNRQLQLALKPSEISNITKP
ncbi:uncharacterized protein LOC132935110 [Metopolophium dirhodum]|uniref:uncharacterized protein LOC132935110 n=1 Tax=Metopolophium dirhodum TaxID=44670 RepID=UPI00298FBB89|nr:uncharacterized protein LOC132935110 [Metopolophium dirhodum]